MHTPLTPLTLRPKPAKPNLQIRDLIQSLRIKFPHPRRAITTYRTTTFFLPAKWFLASHAGKGLFCEFHEAAESGCCDGDGACVVSCEEGVGFCFSEDGLEDSAEGFGELVVEVVFGVDGDVVF